MSGFAGRGTGRNVEMDNRLPNCWEIINCGREKGGDKAAELGECVASKKGMGHSCWAVAGTLCEGEIQGTFARKLGLCNACEVFQLYNRPLGSRRKEVIAHCPEEESHYIHLMFNKPGFL
jgi:hypothetical protein